MKKLSVFLLIVLSLSVSLPVFGKEENKPEIAFQSISNDFIYVKVTIEGVTYIYVYLSDGITLVNIYEEED